MTTEYQGNRLSVLVEADSSPYFGEDHGEEPTSCSKSRRFPIGTLGVFEKSSFHLRKIAVVGKSSFSSRDL